MATTLEAALESKESAEGAAVQLESGWTELTLGELGLRTLPEPELLTPKTTVNEKLKNGSTPLITALVGASPDHYHLALALIKSCKDPVVHAKKKIGCDLFSRDPHPINVLLTVDSSATTMFHILITLEKESIEVS